MWHVFGHTVVCRSQNLFNPLVHIDNGLTFFMLENISYSAIGLWSANSRLNVSLAHHGLHAPDLYLFTLTSGVENGNGALPLVLRKRTYDPSRDTWLDGRFQHVGSKKLMGQRTKNIRSESLFLVTSCYANHRRSSLVATIMTQTMQLVILKVDRKLCASIKNTATFPEQCCNLLVYWCVMFSWK